MLDAVVNKKSGRCFMILMLIILFVAHAADLVVADEYPFHQNAGAVRAWYGGEDGSPPHHQCIGLMEAVLP